MLKVFKRKGFIFMNKGEFIRTSKRMVKEYFNRYVVSAKGARPIVSTNVRIIGLNDETDNYRALFIIPGYYGLYFEVIYNADTKEISSYVYKKVGKGFNKRKEKYNLDEESDIDYTNDNSFRKR